MRYALISLAGRKVFFVSFWSTRLTEYNKMEGISWKWQSIDEARVKSPRAQEAVGPNPTDKGKKRKPAEFVSRWLWSALTTRRNRSKSA